MGGGGAEGEDTMFSAPPLLSIQPRGKELKNNGEIFRTIYQDIHIFAFLPPIYTRLCINVFITEQHNFYYSGVNCVYNIKHLCLCLMERLLLSLCYCF